MARSDPKADLQRYLQMGREVMLWKLEGLADYDIRRPMAPTGTNLLGLVKHLTAIELGYFGDTFGRVVDGAPPWAGEDAEANADMWAAADESREQVVGWYQHAWGHSDATIEASDLDAVGHVPWWPKDRDEVTLHQVLVHVVSETHRHAGHADLVRELIDGAAGLGQDNDNMPSRDRTWWDHYRTRLEAEAQRASSR